MSNVDNYCLNIINYCRLIYMSLIHKSIKYANHTWKSEKSFVHSMTFYDLLLTVKYKYSNDHLLYT